MPSVCLTLKVTQIWQKKKNSGSIFTLSAGRKSESGMEEVILAYGKHELPKQWGACSAGKQREGREPGSGSQQLLRDQVAEEDPNALVMVAVRPGKFSEGEGEGGSEAVQYLK